MYGCCKGKNSEEGANAKRTKKNRWSRVSSSDVVSESKGVGDTMARIKEINRLND